MSVGWHVIGNDYFGESFWSALFLKALEIRRVAKVSMLVSISLVLMLSFVWFQTKKAGSWRLAGSTLSCFGLLGDYLGK